MYDGNASPSYSSRGKNCSDALALAVIRTASAKAGMNLMKRPFLEAESEVGNADTHHSSRSSKGLLAGLSAESAT